MWYTQLPKHKFIYTNKFFPLNDKIVFCRVCVCMHMCTQARAYVGVKSVRVRVL